MNTKIIKNNAGISIIEIVVAIMIITVGMIGVMSAVVQNVRAQYINKNGLIASGLAQEGLELVRNTRDLNWLTPGNSWKQGIGNGSYTVDYGRSGMRPVINSVAGISDARLYVDNQGFYTHTATGNTPTNYYRLIEVVYVSDVSDSHLDITATIRWLDGTQSHDYKAETYLYDWRAGQ